MSKRATAAVVKAFDDLEDHEIADAALRAVCRVYDVVKRDGNAALALDDTARLVDLVDELADRMQMSRDDASKLRLVAAAARDVSAAWARVTGLPGVELDTARRLERDLEDVLRETPRMRRA